MFSGIQILTNQVETRKSKKDSWRRQAAGLDCLISANLALTVLYVALTLSCVLKYGHDCLICAEIWPSLSCINLGGDAHVNG